MDSSTVDAFEFCRLKERREGAIALVDLSRFAADCVDPQGELSWVLQGGHDALGRPQWHLAIKTNVHLECRRCLKPFAFAVDSDSTMLLARDEDEADEWEESLDDDTVEVIVGSRSFNLADMIEDEALLALPLAPKHDECDGGEVPQVKQEKQSPFAVIKELKGLKTTPKQ